MGKWVIVFGAVLLHGCAVELQHALTEEEANEIYVALFSRKLNPQKIRAEDGDLVRYTISVPKQEMARAFEILQKHSLPRPKASGLGVFKATKGMIPTATEERAMFIEALAGEISNALSRVPDTLEARVIVMLPETNDLTQPEKKRTPSASVYIKYLSTPARPGFFFSEEKVKEFVANSVPELKPSAISVLMAQVAEDDLDPADTHRYVETLTAEALKKIIGVLAGLLLLTTGFIIVGLLRKPAKPKTAHVGGPG